ncbi:BPSS1780 family membrane protein [Pseudoalteromonas piscicida]|uniref:BPSS1780 family membrane protein n=1 Tax=Pseudoalteromonas piscicida TaxID=43662 RepID=UPI00309C42D5
MSTPIRTFKASMGIQWLKAGWEIFKTQPLTFMLMYIFMAVVSLLPLLAPVLQIVAALSGPFLSAGFYLAVINKQTNKAIKLADIFEPFAAKGRRLNLFRVGIYQMAGALLLTMVAGVLFSDVATALESVGPNTSPDELIQLIAGNIGFAEVALFVSAQSVVMMAFAFVVPQVFFQGEKRIFHAMKCSLAAFYHNMAALSIFGLVIAALIVASIPLSMIPAIIIMPVAMIGFFVSFQAMFMPIIVDKSQIEQSASTGQDDSGRFDA